MISIFKKIKRIDMSNKDVYDALDNMFQGYLLDDQCENRTVTIEVDAYSEVQKWGNHFVEKAPKNPVDFLKYLSTAYGECPYGNLHGRIMFKYVFNEFFTQFPLGQIWILDIDNSWYDLVWETQSKNSKDTGVNYFGVSPYGFTGFQEENLINSALNVLSFGTYPVFDMEIIFPTANSIICFIPDRGYKYSQMTESNTLYTHLLWKFHHVFDDQWTFDSSRGPKSAFDPVVFNPINILDYFEWYIGKLSLCLDKLCTLNDISRQQTAMTLNGLICDLFFTITSDLPFLSKIFFFNFLDKASNLLSNSSRDEVKTFQDILSEEFLLDNLIKCMETIPGILGDELVVNVKWAVEQLKLDGLNSGLLRDLRNSQHGYRNNLNRWVSLGNHTCEINNDISLLALPIWIYILSEVINTDS